MSSKLLKRAGLSLGALILAIILTTSIYLISINKPRPKANPSPEADALAKQALSAVQDERWQRGTGAIMWTFPRGHEHLWDKRRGYARVRFDGVEVLIDLQTKDGFAYRDGVPIEAPKQSRDLLQKAWALWCNDAFWLNPLTKAFDPGTTRSIVPLEDGRKGLLVSYESGGVTPGDAYLWILDENHRPVAWRMWVSIIPVGGVEFSWDAWQKLSTGAFVATDHRGPLGIPLNLTQVKAAARLSELVPGPDPFAQLVAASSL